MLFRLHAPFPVSSTVERTVYVIAEVLTTVTLKIIVFWSVTPCSLADGFQKKLFPYIFRVEEDGGSRSLQNVGIHGFLSYQFACG
jgi:hypothetical protein